MVRKLSVRRIAFGSRRGQSLVEITIVLPILMITMTGMLSFGITLHNFLVLTNGVNSGAQMLSMSRGQTTDPCSTASTAVQSAAPGLTSSKLTYTFSINGNTYTGTSCGAGAVNMIQGTTAQVSVSYPCTLAVYGMTVPSCTLRAQTADMIQ